MTASTATGVEERVLHGPALALIASKVEQYDMLLRLYPRSHETVTWSSARDSLLASASALSPDAAEQTGGAIDAA